MFNTILLILLSEIWVAIGQVLFKRSANAAGSHTLRDVNSHFSFLKDVLAKKDIWIGFCSMTIGLVVWLFALARADLSLVFPIGSIQYVFILFAAHIFLGEKIDRMKFAGTLLVIFGIILISLS